MVGIGPMVRIRTTMAAMEVQSAGITWIQEAGRGGQEAAWDGGAAARSSFTYTKKV